MTFNPTPALTNEMIQFGSQLSHLSYLEYQSEMIQKFYPEADINTIDQMIGWAKYPTLNLITLDALKHIELTFRKKWIDQFTQIVPRDQFVPYFSETAMERITTASEFGHGIFYVNASLGSSWNNLIALTMNPPGRLKFNETDCESLGIVYHCKFVNNIHSIWTANQSTRVSKSLQTISDIQAALIRSSQAVTDLQADVDRLKQKNADLSYQVQLTAYSLAVLQPANPIYDYHEIKSRKQKLHWEFKRLSKLMKLG